MLSGDETTLQRAASIRTSNRRSRTEAGGVELAIPHMTESPHLRKLLLALSAAGARVFRNNVGMLRDARGQWIKYGVCNPGGSDCVGWMSVTVTPEMVGRRVAVFTAIEAKVDAAVTEEQRNFLRQVSDAGGIALVVRNEGAIPAAVEMVRQWPRMPGDAA